MRRKNVVKLALGAAAVAAAAGGTMIYRRYLRETAEARNRLKDGSHVLDTSRGPIEVAIHGDGLPVLLSSGEGGGYDQALAMGRTWLGEGFTWIAPSRFGFLRAALPGDASPAAQADAYVALLDALRIDRAAVVATSSGGPAAMQFALRHPDRASALVLLAAAAWGPPGQPALRTIAFPEWLTERIVDSDFLFWAAATYIPSATATLLGAPPKLMKAVGSDERKRARETVRGMLPISDRRPGMQNDREVIGSLYRYRLEDIHVPTLVVHACDDRMTPIGCGEYTCSSVPKAEGIFYDAGGHLLLGHREDVNEAIRTFLHRHAAVKPKRAKRTHEEPVLTI